jgi:hypothetical protein
VDVDHFLDQLNEAVGPVPEFTKDKPAEEQFHGWIKWSGAKQLYNTMATRLRGIETPED